MKKKAESKSAGGTKIPPQVLRIPWVQGLLKGQIPAVGFNPALAKQFEAELEPVIKSLDALSEYGVLPYVSEDKQNGALFNATKIDPADVAAADQQGRLFEVAPLLGQQGAGAAPEAGAGAAPVAGAGAPVPPAPAAVQRTRTSNAAQMSTFDGPKPGTGYTNRISKPLV